MPVTPNYNWIIPTVTGDLNVWGTILNTLANTQDPLLRAIENCNRGLTAPATLQAGTLWVDTSGTNPEVLKIYDGIAWATIGNISTSAHTFTAANASADFIGDYKISLQTSNHGSWLLCNGAAISRTTYATLYTLGGGTGAWPFGQGDGTTTFNLPDLRGLVAAAQGLNTNAAYSPPLSTRTNGQYLGAETHILTTTELPVILTTTADIVNITNGPGGGQDALNPVAGTRKTGQVNNIGGSQPHENMQPTLIAGNYFIYTGV